MTIKILNEIEGTNLVRVEIDKKISLIYKDDLEALQKKKKSLEPEEDIDIDINTICGFKFVVGSWGCSICDNLEYCKSQEKRRCK